MFPRAKTANYPYTGKRLLAVLTAGLFTIAVLFYATAAHAAHGNHSGSRAGGSRPAGTPHHNGGHRGGHWRGSPGIIFSPSFGPGFGPGFGDPYWSGYYGTDWYGEGPFGRVRRPVRLEDYVEAEPGTLPPPPPKAPLTDAQRAQRLDAMCASRVFSAEECVARRVELLSEM